MIKLSAILMNNYLGKAAKHKRLRGTLWKYEPFVKYKMCPTQLGQGQHWLQ